MAVQPITSAALNPPVRQVAGKKPFVCRLINLLIASLLFSILIEWTAMAWTYEHSAAHSRSMLNQDIGYLQKDFTHVVAGVTQAELIGFGVATVYRSVFQQTGLERALLWAGTVTGVSAYLEALVNITLDFMVRVGILVFSLPLFLLFTIVGVSGGLTLRDIRRWSGGREYGGVYHRAKWLAPKALLLVWFLYLALPISVHPNAVVLPCAVLFSLNVMILSASYKKYL